MVKKLSYLIYKILKILDIFLHKITGRSFLIWFSEFIDNDSYKKIKILDRDVKFFVPNYITNWLIDEFYTKEPETLEWIDSFEKEENKIIFWDIGANIGVYSIYAALKHPNIEVVSFEPSNNNLRILTRNISINKLEEKIKVNQFPLSNAENKYLVFKESKFIAGGSLNTWGENYNFENKSLDPQNNYKIYGTTINYLLNNNILAIPNYIKIDVDGIEHLILRGASKYLKNPNIKSLSIELDESFKKQFDSAFNTMKENNFNFKHKKRAKTLEAYKYTFNYVFKR